MLEKLDTWLLRQIHDYPEKSIWLKIVLALFLVAAVGFIIFRTWFWHRNVIPAIIANKQKELEFNKNVAVHDAVKTATKKEVEDLKDHAAVDAAQIKEAALRAESDETVIEDIESWQDVDNHVK